MLRATGKGWGCREWHGSPEDDIESAMKNRVLTSEPIPLPKIANTLRAPIPIAAMEAEEKGHIITGSPIGIPASEVASHCTKPAAAGAAATTIPNFTSNV